MPALRSGKETPIHRSAVWTLICVADIFQLQVLHSAAAENGQGALFTGDQPQVCPDRRWVSFMYSYPNFVLSTQPACAGSLQRSSRLR